MKITENELKIGVPAAFDVLHASDTHITLATESDGERKMRLAKRRTEIFPDASDNMRELEKIRNETGFPLLHTGDLIDFTSEPDFEAGAEFIRRTDCFSAVGNHEFSQYVGEAWEDDAYKAQSADKVAAMCKNGIFFDSRVIGGVNFVAMDNSYYFFKPEQLTMLKNEVKKGLPIVLMFHVPLFERNLFDKIMNSGAESAGLAAVPPELMTAYPDIRRRQQTADAPTLAMTEYIAAEPGIKAILTGHVHFDYDGTFAGRIPQLITGCRTVRKIHII